LLLFTLKNHYLLNTIHEKSKTILINDDGISAPGIRALIAVMFIGEVVVVAPDKPQSAMGRTINNTLYQRL
jgi:5'-nucleotidase